MDGPIDILVGPESGDHVALRLLDVEYPEATDDADGHWISSEVRVAVPGFHGRVETSIRSPELHALLGELRVLASTRGGTAKLETLEEEVHLVLVSDGKGHVDVSGYIARRLSAKLQFWFTVDASALATAIAALEHAIQVLPMVGVDERTKPSGSGARNKS